jgi:hypothetical protein
MVTELAAAAAQALTVFVLHIQVPAGWLATAELHLAWLSGASNVLMAEPVPLPE